MGIFAPSEQPLIQLHSVDVMELNKVDKIMGLTVHVICWEHEFQSHQVRKRTSMSVERALNYLISEGFITSVKGWHVNIAIFGHPPKGF